MSLGAGTPVKVLRGGGFLNHMIGETGVVEYVLPERILPYHVKCEKTGNHGNFYEDELEVINQ